MKRLFSVLALVVLGAVTVNTQSLRPVTLAWDLPSDYSTWTEVRIYNAVTPATPVLLGTVKCSGSPLVCPTEVTLNLAKATYSFIARSFDGTWESEDSNAVTLKPPAFPPNLRKR